MVSPVACWFVGAAIPSVPANQANIPPQQHGFPLVLYTALFREGMPMLPFSTENPVQRLIWSFADAVKPRHARRGRKPKTSTLTDQACRGAGAARKRKTRRAKKSAKGFTRDFEDRIENRLAAAENLICFADPKDWDRLKHILLSAHPDPDAESGMIRLHREDWEEACDLLWVDERQAELKEEEKARSKGYTMNGQVLITKKHGPPRWIEFNRDDYAKLLRIILPERFANQTQPDTATSSVPGTATKIRAMSARQEQGVSIWHDEDTSQLEDRLALCVEGVGNHAKHAATVRDGNGEVRLAKSQVVGHGWQEDRERRDEAKSGERLSLVGCIEADGDDDEYWNPGRSGAAESGCRRVRDGGS